MTDPGSAPGGPEPGPEGGRLQPTSTRVLIIAAVLGGAGAFALGKLAELITGVPLQLSWAGPVALLAIAGCVAAIAIGAWRRLRTDRRPVEPERAVALLALGKSAALAGALLAGGYLVFALLSLGAIAAPAPRLRVITSLVAVVGGVGIMIAGLVLERACRVPDDDSANNQEN
ncbi:DUF3180 domain-containing protein [Naumannella cuiyingiana]|uniref:DUF3180 domain-containing protein n=1 Tax=Naumannella cuiyingiana TaxID=1347891 RepID=A0A7Z0ILD2_9ACTN|nr:DUF3180 domain-containing protein [Naumannella cuiyingiana]NYI71436.1 hypothetical protein [Naumannella cuiyingiana]